MKNLNQILANDYSKHMDSLTFGDTSRLYNLYEKPVHTPVIRKIVAMNIALVAVIAAFGTSAAAVGMTVRDVVNAKTQNLSITDEKRDEMASRMEEWNIEPEQFAGENFEVGANENGDTYGFLFDGVDLVAVAAVPADGKIVQGYVYREDFEQLNGYNSESSPEALEAKAKAIENGEVRNWIYVYDTDGVTVLGKYVSRMGKDGDEYNEPALTETGYRDGFLTNEELENENLAGYFFDGTDIDDYEALAESRAAQK